MQFVAVCVCVCVNRKKTLHCDDSLKTTTRNWYKALYWWSHWPFAMKRCICCFELFTLRPEIERSVDPYNNYAIGLDNVRHLYTCMCVYVGQMKGTPINASSVCLLCSLHCIALQCNQSMQNAMQCHIASMKHVWDWMPSAELRPNTRAMLNIFQIQSAMWSFAIGLRTDLISNICFYVWVENPDSNRFYKWNVQYSHEH